MAEKFAKLTIDDKTIELPILTGTLGPSVIDIANIARSGYFTYDPGFKATAACESKITFIDGGKGELLHAGYPIQELARLCSYTQVCHLILFGELPTKAEHKNFIAAIKEHSALHQKLNDFFNGFPANAHPMAILASVVAALSSFYHENLNVNNKEHRERVAMRLIAKLPTIAAMCYKHSIGEDFISPDSSLSYSENFLHMMFSAPDNKKTFSKEIVSAMDKIFILHADHEQNASTSTVRLAGSSGANPYACIAAGIAALWGPAHGGANEAVISMLEEIGHVDNIDKYIAKAKDKHDNFRLMGFGHRVYKNFDPRAVVMRESCHAVLQELGQDNDQLFNIALKLEKIALEDEYFIKKKLYPNVDFYSGIILKALGIPTSMFTVIFALARTVGWISQWHEMLSTDNLTIGRPRQMYTGDTKREVAEQTVLNI